MAEYSAHHELYEAEIVDDDDDHLGLFYDGR